MRLFAFLITVLSLCVSGCTSSMVIHDWADLPPNSPIVIHTRDGNHYDSENWQIDRDSNIVGMAKTGFNSWRSFTIPIHSVVNATVPDSPTTKAAGTTVIVIGSAAILAAVVGVYYVVSHSPVGLGWGR